jgi:hypothetical protein
MGCPLGSPLEGVVSREQGQPCGWSPGPGGDMVPLLWNQTRLCRGQVPSVCVQCSLSFRAQWLRVTAHITIPQALGQDYGRGVTGD